MSLYLRLLHALRPHRALFVWAALAMAALSLATGLFSWLVGPLFQFLFTGGNLPPDMLARALPMLDPARLDRETLIKAVPILILAISLVRGAAYFVQFYCMGILGQRVVADLRLLLHRKLLALPPAYFARVASGDLLSRFGNDVAAVEFAVTYGLAAWVRDGLQVIVLLSVCIALDWRLAFFAFVAVPITVVPIVRFAKRLKKIGARGQEQIGALYTLLHEVLAGVRIVQAFGMEQYEEEKFVAEQQRFLKTMEKSFFVRAIFTPTLELMAAVGIAATFIYALHAVATHTLQPERVISFLASVVILYTPLKSLGGIGQGVTLGLVSANRLYEVLDAAAELPERADAREAPRFSSELRFEKVSFAYPGRAGSRLAILAEEPPAAAKREKLSTLAKLSKLSKSITTQGGPTPDARSAKSDAPLVLDGIDLSLRRGEVVALVGSSGGGKTTLLQLVPRFADPTSGQVLFDGVPLTALKLQSLRAQVALVAQETFLFNDTVRANIAYGLPDIDPARLEAASRAALAHDFITALPQGYDTPVGERGVTLSGGQRQRLAIARALLKDAPILLLDEATSALDTESEREVQRALDRLMRDRTCLVIAHRLSTIRHAHRIAVLAGGRIVELGTHDELMARGGDYARLYQLQFAPLEQREPLPTPGEIE